MLDVPDSRAQHLYKMFFDGKPAFKVDAVHLQRGFNQICDTEAALSKDAADGVFALGAVQNYSGSEC